MGCRSFFFNQKGHDVTLDTLVLKITNLDGVDGGVLEAKDAQEGVSEGLAMEVVGGAAGAPDQRPVHVERHQHSPPRHLLLRFHLPRTPTKYPPSHRHTVIRNINC